MILGNNVVFGGSSPELYSNYGYMDIHQKANIKIGDNVIINNSFAFFCGTQIEIGSHTLIGLKCEIIDSDGHDLDPNKRMNGNPKCEKIQIGNNVFIGSNVKILKGVTIGDNSVVAHSSVVTKSIPANVVAGGIPAKILKSLES